LNSIRVMQKNLYSPQSGAKEEIIAQTIKKKQKYDQCFKEI